jgi:glycine/D-amino acid oxidase-like deaminating enzyme
MTGQRLAETVYWEEALPQALALYASMEATLGIEALRPLDALFFHKTPEAEDLFARRAAERPDKMEADVRFPADFVHAPYGAGRVSPAWALRTGRLITAWQQKLRLDGLFRDEYADPAQLLVTGEGVTYRDIRAERVVFCNGEQAYDHPYWQALPFVRNKGEALILSVPGLPRDILYKGPLSLLPWGDDAANDRFWAGASYAMEFEHAAPTAAYLEKTRKVLSDWLKVPFTVREHLSALRPSSVDRKPFVGWHPVYSRAGILNGMGSKGSLHAPIFARQLADSVSAERTIFPAVDVMRAARALSRLK